jgi:hypothetical protein
LRPTPKARRGSSCNGFAIAGLICPDATRAAIVKWAAKQDDRPTLSEAIRRLVELGLQVRGE